MAFSSLKEAEHYIPIVFLEGVAVVWMLACRVGLKNKCWVLMEPLGDEAEDVVLGSLGMPVENKTLSISLSSFAL